MSLFGSWRSAKAQEDERWREVQRIEGVLHGTWGLGVDEEGQGCRARLRRLCAFLAELEPEPFVIHDSESDFDKLELGLSQTQTGCGAREDYLCRLEDLSRALEALAPTDGADVSRYLQRWEGWSPSVGVLPERQASLERTLAALGAIAKDPERPDQTARGLLWTMAYLLDGLKAHATSDAHKTWLKDARVHWQECLEDCAGDWEWAWLQVLVRLAQECLRDKPFHSKCCEHAEIAKEALEKAIPRLESKGFNQSRTQGLYGMLAATCLMLGRKAGTSGPEKPPGRAGKAGGKPQERAGKAGASGPEKALERALVYARRAVAMEPASSRDRLALLEVLAALGDPEDIRIQAEIALNLDSGSDTLRTIGETYWDRAAALRSRGVRRKLLCEAARFFTTALENVESAPLDERGPLDQIEAHAWAHFWLGRFQSELGRFASASAQLQTACKFGFKPLEARVELAWTCLLDRDHKHGDQAFHEAMEEAQHWLPPLGELALGVRRTFRLDAPATVAEAPGENRPVVELAFEGYLGWAFLCADWDPERAVNHARRAEKLLSSIVERKRRELQNAGLDENSLRSIVERKRRELQAALLEVRGRVALHTGKLGESLELLERSIRLSPGSGAYCALGLASLRRVGISGKGTPAVMRRAREAYILGRGCDIRGRHRRELGELRRELRKRGELGGPRHPRQPEPQRPAQAAPPMPSSPPSPVLPTAPATPTPARGPEEGPNDGKSESRPVPGARRRV